MLGCKHSSFPFKYLGLPLSDSRLCKQDYIPLVQKVSARLTGWGSKLLNIARKLVLVNSVLSSIPIYYMSVFSLPQWALDDLERTRRTFLWQGADPNEGKIHLANWTMICKPKKLGGLGVIELALFNQALLEKWQWQQQETKLWTALFRTLYCATDIHGVDKSYLFQAHLKNSAKFCQCFFLSLPKQGNTVRFWEQDWGLGVLKKQIRNVIYLLHTTTVLLTTSIAANQSSTTVQTKPVNPGNRTATRFAKRTHPVQSPHPTARHIRHRS